MNTPTPRTDAEIEGWSNGLKHVAHTHLCSRDTVLDTIEFLNELQRERDQLRKELAESQSWVKASMESAAIASSTIARLETERDTLQRQRNKGLETIAALAEERDQLRDWAAREIQQMPDMGGGVQFAWEKLDEQSRSMWRMRADEAASRLAAQGLERKTK